MTNTDLRNSIIDWLQLIASADAQRKYEQIAGTIAGDELVETWFSLFHPDTALHKQVFTEQETCAINKFHNFFDIYEPNLPSTVALLQENSNWIKIMQKANEVISKCGW